MINAENTLYSIQYDYDLNGATITIPNNSMLYFFGGSLKNGTLSLPFSPTVLEGRVKMTQVTVNYTAGIVTLDNDERRVIYPFDISIVLPVRLSRTGLDYLGGKWWEVQAQVQLKPNTSGTANEVIFVVQYPSTVTSLTDGVLTCSGELLVIG